MLSPSFWELLFILLYVIPELAETLPQLGHVVGDGIEVHQSRCQVAAALARVQSIHHDLFVASIILCQMSFKGSFASMQTSLGRKHTSPQRIFC